MKQGSLITMAGPSNGLDVRSMSNMEAGLAFLGLANQVHPGITWGQLVELGTGNGQYMGRSFWDKVGGALGDVKDSVSDVVSKTVSTVGDVAGSAIRLVTDEKVIDGASRLGTAYVSGGQSEAAKGVLGQLGDFVSHIGATVKDTASGGAAATGPAASYLKPVNIAIAGVVVVGVVLVARSIGGGNRSGRR